MQHVTASACADGTVSVTQNRKRDHPSQALMETTRSNEVRDAGARHLPFSRLTSSSVFSNWGWFFVSVINWTILK